MKIREIKELLNNISEEYDDFDFVIKVGIPRNEYEDDDVLVTQYLTDIDFDTISKWSSSVYFEGFVEVE